jgi:hypothetical protein
MSLTLSYHAATWSLNVESNLFQRRGRSMETRLVATISLNDTQRHGRSMMIEQNDFSESHLQEALELTGVRSCSTGRMLPLPLPVVLLALLVLLVLLGLPAPVPGRTAGGRIRVLALILVAKCELWRCSTLMQRRHQAAAAGPAARPGGGRRQLVGLADGLGATPAVLEDGHPEHLAQDRMLPAVLRARLGPDGLRIEAAKGPGPQRQPLARILVELTVLLRGGELYETRAGGGGTEVGSVLVKGGLLILAQPPNQNRCRSHLMSRNTSERQCRTTSCTKRHSR